MPDSIMPTDEQRITALEDRVAELEDALLWVGNTLAMHGLPHFDTVVLEMYDKAKHGRREFSLKGR
jgi:hypothetical protein